MTRFLRCTLGLALVLSAAFGPYPGSGAPRHARTRFRRRAPARSATRPSGRKWNGGGSRLRVWRPVPIRTPPPAALPLFESNQVRYTPEAGFVGEDGFTYVVADGIGGTDEGAVTVSVVNRSVPTPGTCGTGFAQGDLNTSNVFARDVQHRLHHLRQRIDSEVPGPPRQRDLSPLRGRAVGRRHGRRPGPGELAPDITTSRSGPAPSTRTARSPNPTDCSAFDRIYVVSTPRVPSVRGDRRRPRPTSRAGPSVWERPPSTPAASLWRRSRAGARWISPRASVPSLFGHQTAFWVMNDVGGPHTALGTEPLGIEVRVSAFAPARATSRWGRQRRRSTATRSSTAVPIPSRPRMRGSLPTPTSEAPPTITSGRTPGEGWHSSTTRTRPIRTTEPHQRSDSTS